MIKFKDQMILASCLVVATLFFLTKAGQTALHGCCSPSCQLETGKRAEYCHSRRGQTMQCVCKGPKCGHRWGDRIITTKSEPLFAWDSGTENQARTKLNLNQTNGNTQNKYTRGDHGKCKHMRNQLTQMYIMAQQGKWGQTKKHGTFQSETETWRLD